MNQVATSNGNGQHTEIPPLPEVRVKEAENFIFRYQAREHELDKLKADLQGHQEETRAQLHDRDVRIHQLEKEIEAMARQRQLSDDRALACQRGRDEAIDKAAVAEAALKIVKHALKGAGMLDEPA